MQKRSDKFSASENLKKIIKLMRSVDKFSCAAIFIRAAVGTAIPLLAPAALGLLINALVNGDRGGKTALIIIALVLLTALLSSVESVFENRLLWTLGTCLRAECMSLIMNKSMSVAYENIESREKRKMREKAEKFCWNNDSGAGGIPVMLSRILICFLGIFTVLAVVPKISFWLFAVLCAAGAVILLMIFKLAEKEKKFSDDSYAVEVKERYLTFGKPTDITAAKDIRIYNISSWFTPLIDILIGDRRRIMKDFFRDFSKYRLAELAVVLIRDGATVYYLTRGVLSGKIGIGDFAFYFGLINAYSAWIYSMAEQLGQLKQNHLNYCDFREFTEQPDETDGEFHLADADLYNGVEIEFKNVSFSYESGKNTIDGVSFKAARGEKIALVGENGAGKTTLMKLLCGLYSQDGGEILIGGTDTSQIPAPRQYSLFSAVFQEALQISGTVRENVSMKSDGDGERVISCLKKAGLYEKISSLPSGIDTNIDRSLCKDAVTLSGGEMQKLLLSRALYKDAPIIVLDEPTAALDPIAENELYMRFSELTRGKTAFYISHRLASTRFCDKILFLQDGKITESGTHDELMQKKGAYYRMYEMQSYYYKNEGETLI